MQTKINAFFKPRTLLPQNPQQEESDDDGGHHLLIQDQEDSGGNDDRLLITLLHQNPQQSDDGSHHPARPTTQVSGGSESISSSSKSIKRNYAQLHLPADSGCILSVLDEDHLPARKKKVLHMDCTGPSERHPTRLAVTGHLDEDASADDTVPHPPPLVKKKRGQRGSAKGNRVLEARRKIGGLKLPLILDPTHGTKSYVGPYQAMYKSEVGRFTRARCPPNKPWDEINTSVQNQIVHDLEENFENIVPEIVLSDARELFRKGKSRLKGSVQKHKEKHNDVPPPKPANVETNEIWMDYLDRINTPAFTKKSEQNAVNRAKQEYITRTGRTSLTQRRANGDPEGLDPFVVWEETHKNKDGTWIHEAASRKFEELMRLRLEISPDGSRLTPEQEKRVFRIVLGVRRDYLVGLGPSQPSSATTRVTQSEAFEKDKTIAALEKKVAEQDKQMKNIIASLEAANIPILNKETNNDDDDEKEETETEDWGDNDALV